MDIMQAVVFGAVEGITEFLPISSTGHLILTAKILGLSQTNFLKSFEIAIQLGAILSVVVLYGKSLWADARVMKRILAAFVPTALVGLIFYKMIKRVLLNYHEIVLWSLLTGGVLLIVFELFHHEKKEADAEISQISYTKACLIGIFQSIAVIPGVSRSAATILGGLLLGLKRKTIVEFSFLLAVPTMLAATALDLVKNIETFSASQMTFLSAGFVMSFAVAIASIKFLLYFIRSHSFIGFGVYRILTALFFWFIVWK